MRALVQRVSSASVTVDEKAVSKISQGMLIFLGISKTDSEKEGVWMAKKLLQLKLFSDEKGRLSNSIEDIDGEILVVSQFTLYGECKKGRKPDFSKAAEYESAKALYQDFLKQLTGRYPKVQNGVFGASMQVELVNDGPVTLFMES